MATPFSTIVVNARRLILESLALITPVGPLVGQVGTPGAASVTYVIVARNSTGHSPGSQPTTTTTANGGLSGTNFNRLNWTPVARATSYQVYRTAGGPNQGLIGTVSAPVTTFDDTGLAGDGSTPPTTNTSGTLGINQFWSDDELFGYAVGGCRDLWRAIIDLHQEHFATIDVTNVSVLPNTEALAGVPIDTFRVLLIEPRDTSQSSPYGFLKFRPGKYNSHEFRRLRTHSPVDPMDGGTILYDILQAGSPVAAPQVLIAPLLASTIPLRFMYVPTLEDGTTRILSLASMNPIPGESDWAVTAYTVAYALGKQDGDTKAPNPTWLGIYNTEKTSILVAAAPRQEQEALVRPGIFDDCYDDSWW